MLTVLAGENLPAGTSLRFVRDGDAKADVQLAQLQQRPVDALLAALRRVQSLGRRQASRFGSCAAPRKRGRRAGGRQGRALQSALLASRAATVAEPRPWMRLTRSSRSWSRASRACSRTIRRAFTYYGTQTYLVGEREVAVIDPGPGPARACRRAGRRRSAGGRSPRSCAPTPTAITARQRGRWRTRPARRSSAARRWRWRRSARAPTQRSMATMRRTGCLPTARRSRSMASRWSRWRRRAIRPTISASPMSGALFTGDHVMGWSTTVVVPPDGDMAAYMASLDKLRRRDDRVYYPAHGAAGDQPAAICRGI